MTRELKARRQRSNSLAETSKSAEKEKDQRTRRNKKARSKSARGASKQGTVSSSSRRGASSAHDRLTVEQEIQVCKAIQRFQEVQAARRDFLRAEVDKLKAAGSSQQPDCTDSQWAEAAGEPSVKALGAALNRGRHALAALIQSYTYAINKFAAEFVKQGVEFDEASEAAGTALVHAAARFDTTLGIRLSTYAWPVIRNDLGRLVDKQAHIVRLPQRSRQRMRQINETYHELLHTLGRPPSMEEVAAEAKMSLKHAIALRRTMHGTSSFEADMVQSSAANGKVDSTSTPAETIESGEDGGGIDDLQDPIDAISSFGGEGFHREFMDRLAMCMDLLADQKAAQAVRLRYGVLDGKQRTLEEVSKAMKPSVSVGTAYNLVQRAFDQLRSSEWRMRPIQPLLDHMQTLGTQPAMQPTGSRLRHTPLRATTSANGSIANYAEPTSILWLLLCTSALVSRAWPQMQLAILAGLEIIYAGLHIYPLCLLAVPGPVTAEVFMQAFTKAQYFGSELSLLISLACCAPLRQAIWTLPLAVHIAFHVLYFVLTCAARPWCLQQNLDRIQERRDHARSSLLKTLWNLLLNLLNSADAALHFWYAWVLVRLCLAPG
ncbi:hypothetical protein WJX73_008633 [Symbiochloris irregularis]|uniref:RNA polymerase sigma-70 region 2 domain-containing protein n=1 Tax=Symbiochloris irregularis TaxID=706552 RepID=A0AAW1NVW9_9CHLO